MDGDALREQARALHLDPFELALHYRSLGLPASRSTKQTPGAWPPTGAPR